MPAHVSSISLVDAAPPILRERVATRISRARIFTLAAEPIATGMAQIRPLAVGWTATLSSLDRPGTITNAYFVEGLRDVVVHLVDGQRAAASITGTTFTARNERIFELRGVGGFV